MKPYSKIFILFIILLFSNAFEVDARDRGASGSSAKEGAQEGRTVGRSTSSGVGWIVNITADLSADQSRVMFGMIPEGSDGYERGHDALISSFKAQYIRAGSSPIALYFERPDWEKSHPYAWIDMVSDSLPYEWTLSSLTASAGTAVQLNWNLSSLQSSVGLELVDNFSGTTVDMVSVSSYSYTSAVDVVRTFTIKATGTGAGAGSGATGLRTR